jgi:hypothetical protein
VPLRSDMPPYILAMKPGNPPHYWCHSDRATICQRMLSVITELLCLCRYSIVYHVLGAFGTLIGFFAVLPEPSPSRKLFHSRRDLICSHPIFQYYILTDQERECDHVYGEHDSAYIFSILDIEHPAAEAHHCAWPPRYFGIIAHVCVSLRRSPTGLC